MDVKALEAKKHVKVLGNYLLVITYLQWGRNEIFLGEDLFNKNFEITNF